MMFALLERVFTNLQQNLDEKQELRVRYFELLDDMSLPDRWLLDDPVDDQGQEVDPWQFRKGRVLEISGESRLVAHHPGHALDFSLSTMIVPVVHERVVAIFNRLGLQEQVQFFPARVEGKSSRYFLLNVLRIIPCIDESRCEEIEYWKPEDGEPEKVGQYRAVSGLRIDPGKVEGAHIFRPWGWRVVIIVSEHLKQALEREGITGTKFIEV